MLEYEVSDEKHVKDGYDEDEHIINIHNKCKDKNYCGTFMFFLLIVNGRIRLVKSLINVFLFLINLYLTGFVLRS